MSSEATVYVVQAQGTDLYKIGVTSGSVRTRIDSLSTASPYPLSLILAVKVQDGRTAESTLHSLVEGHRLNGEWFKLDGENLVRVKELAETMGTKVEDGGSDKRSLMMAFRITDDELARLDKMVETAAVGELAVKITRAELMRRLFLRGLVVTEKEQGR